MATAGTHSLQVEASGGGATYVKTFLVNVAKATPTFSISPTSCILYRNSGNYSTQTIQINTVSDGKISIKGSRPDYTSSISGWNRSTMILTFSLNGMAATQDPTRFSSLAANTAVMTIKALASDYYLQTGEGTFSIKNVIAPSITSINWVEP